MYCPKCGQQQVAENLKFCSRCGLPITGLSQWVNGSHEGALSDNSTLSLAIARRDVSRRAAKLLFMAGVLLPIFGGISIAMDSAVPLVFAFLILFFAFSLWLYTRMFGAEAQPGRNAQQTSTLGTMPRSAALPPADLTEVGNHGSRTLETGEMVQPASVTERTTKLLDRE